ncbi:EAL domain-containing protein [Bacillus sp. CGMCC 1.16607]|uniref:EAL domain-containing protein n=1 Tax=Bacillus sp. CGMCC 1.16607 TaxID=3351842 RepID=UPI0036266DF4
MDKKEILASEFINFHLESKMEKMIIDIIFRHVKDMVFIMKVEDGPKFRYMFANESGLNKAGIPKDSIGRQIEEVMAPERAIYLQREYENLISSEVTNVFSDEILLENGKSVFGESILTPVKDMDGKIQYVVSITRDVTENLIEKNRLIESEQHYRSIVDHNLDAIFSIDLDGNILESNPAAHQLAGYENDKMNMSIFDLISEGDLVSFKDLLDQSRKGYSLESMDCRFLHRSKNLLTVHIKTVPIVIFNEIKGIYVIIRDISEQAKHAENIKYMAFHDQLTGLFNRRSLLDHLQEEILLAKQSNREFALLTIDLDRFKYLNDTLGHLIGDEILKSVARRLSSMKVNDTKVYRQGGDEFMLLLCHTNRSDAARFAERILANFTNSFYIQSQEYYITPSIGISMFPFDGEDSETLIKNADEALFRVKERGKAHYQFYRSDMNSSINNIVSLETHLRKAIEKDELTLYYQPQIDLSTTAVNSFEALLRWNCAELGFISPGEFIPLAEDTGLIIPIGNWVIETACRQIRSWNDKGFNDIRIAINISPIQFQQSNLVNTIKTMIENFQISPSTLEIEITEGAMGDKKETIPILKKLKKLGVSISVDDFGTGYSSLSYLKQFPIDVLKIDQSFVKDILHNEKDAAITSTIIHLGRSLGLEVIAEGVEYKEQVEFLLKAECQKVQGFYFSKPLQANEIEREFLVGK